MFFSKALLENGHAACLMCSRNHILHYTGPPSASHSRMVPNPWLLEEKETLEMICPCTFQSFPNQDHSSLSPLPASPPEPFFLEPCSLVQMRVPAIDHVRNLAGTFKSSCLVFTPNQYLDRTLEHLDTHLGNNISGL